LIKNKSVELIVKLFTATGGGAGGGGGVGPGTFPFVPSTLELAPAGIPDTMEEYDVPGFLPKLVLLTNKLLNSAILVCIISYKY
jgi:hypothetical protein